MKRFALFLALLGVTSSFVLTSCANTETPVEDAPAVEEVAPEALEEEVPAVDEITPEEEAEKSLEKEDETLKEESSLEEEETVEEAPATEEAEPSTP